jgi:hypothetical protein
MAFSLPMLSGLAIMTDMRCPRKIKPDSKKQNLASEEGDEKQYNCKFTQY